MSAALYPVAILAGGLATRLGPLTAERPKSLVDVNGEPFVAHQLRLLRDAGAARVVLCVGHLGEMTRAWVGDGLRFGLAVEYSFDGPRLLGTAGALARALPLLGDAFFVLYGDSYLPCDLRAAQRAFAASGRAALMTVYRNEDRGDRSNVELSGGRIAAYDKAQPSARMRHIDYGLGVLARRALDGVAPDQPSDLAALYQALLARGELAAWETDQPFYEIGSPGGLAALRQHLAVRASATGVAR